MYTIAERCRVLYSCVLDPDSHHLWNYLSFKSSSNKMQEEDMF